MTDWLSFILNITRIFKVGSSGAKALIFYACLAAVILVLLDALYVGWQFSQNKFRYVFPIKMLRSASDLVIGPLYIPVRGVSVFSSLTRVAAGSVCFTCFSSLPCAIIAQIVAVFTNQIPCADYETDCWSSATHIVLTVVSTLVGLMYICFSVLLVGSYYSRDPIADKYAGDPIFYIPDDLEFASFFSSK